MIGVEDTLVVAYEKNGFDGNTCYVPRYHLSDFSTKKRFGPGLNNYEHGAKANEIFYTRILLNWAIISAPRHPILIRTMENLVEVIRSDFLREPVLRYLKLDYRWRLVMCATGPSMMTASARELVLEQLFARGPNSTSDVMDSGKIRCRRNNHSFPAILTLHYLPSSAEPGGHSSSSTSSFHL